MKPAGSVEFAWDTADGKRHNFSHASHQLCPGLFVASAPCAELPGGGPGEEDMGLRMMALTSWLDLLCKCKVKHVLCLLSKAEMGRRFADLGVGDLDALCRSQGLSFQSVDDEASASSVPPSPKVLADAVGVLRRIRPTPAEGTVIFCADGRLLSAAVAAAWVSLECGKDTAAAVQAVEASAAQVGASRSPLDLFGSEREQALEAFVQLVLDTSRFMAEAPVSATLNSQPEATTSRQCEACGAASPPMCCSRCKAVFFCDAECQRSA